MDLNVNAIDSSKSAARKKPRTEKVLDQRSVPRELGICGDVFKLVTPENSDAQMLSSVIVEIHPGQSSDSHFHIEREEIFYFTSGTGLLITGSRRHKVRAGMIAYIPASLPHKIINGERRTLRVFVAGTPPFSLSDTVSTPL